MTGFTSSGARPDYSLLLKDSPEPESADRSPTVQPILKSPGQAETVDRMDQPERPNRLFDLVRLKMAYKMPLHTRFERINLGQGFLHAILTQDGYSDASASRIRAGSTPFVTAISLIFFGSRSRASPRPRYAPGPYRDSPEHPYP